MKKGFYILCLFVISFAHAFGQSNGYMRNDSIFLTNKTKSAVIILQNATKDSTGLFAKNIGKGVLQYQRIHISDVKGLSDSLSHRIFFSQNFKFVDSVLDLADTVTLNGTSLQRTTLTGGFLNLRNIDGSMYSGYNANVIGFYPVGDTTNKAFQLSVYSGLPKIITSAHKGLQYNSISDFTLHTGLTFAPYKSVDSIAKAKADSIASTKYLPLLLTGSTQVTNGSNQLEFLSDNGTNNAFLKLQAVPTGGHLAVVTIQAGSDSSPNVSSISVQPTSLTLSFTNSSSKARTLNLSLGNYISDADHNSLTVSHVWGSALGDSSLLFKKAADSLYMHAGSVSLTYIDTTSKSQVKTGGLTLGKNISTAGDTWTFFGTSETAGTNYTNPFSYALNTAQSNQGVAGSNSGVLASLYSSIPTYSSTTQRGVSVEETINDNVEGVSLATHKANLIAWVAQCRTKGFPLKRILIINANYAYKTNLTQLATYCAADMVLADSLGVQKYDAYNYTLNNGGKSLVGSDSLHLTIAGGIVYARGMQAAINGGLDVNTLDVINSGNFGGNLSVNGIGIIAGQLNTGADISVPFNSSLKYVGAYTNNIFTTDAGGSVVLRTGYSAGTILFQTSKGTTNSVNTVGHFENNGDFYVNNGNIYGITTNQHLIMSDVAGTSLAYSSTGKVDLVSNLVTVTSGSLAYAFGSTGLNIGSTTAPATNVKFQVTSTSQASIPAPIMNTTQINAISSATDGMQAYDNVLHVPKYYNGSAWVSPGGGLTSSNFVDSETPSGTINGTNTTFTLANTPTTGSVKLYRNGVRVTNFTVSTATITTSGTTTPLTGDSLIADYRK